jgi:hypothetical protein
MTTRRQFLRDLGISAAALPLVMGLPSLGFGHAANTTPRKQRLIFMFSPNGTLPNKFWPDEEGDQFTLKPIVEPLAPFKDRLLFLRGLSNKVRGDGDGHMRGMSCLLTGIELFPGNIQGGSDTPAGWASGPSVDQAIKDFLQSKPETRTRFGSMELGVVVPDRADPWTRWIYAGANKPVAPLDDPYQVFEKMYGRVQERETLKSVLDDVTADLRKVRASLSAEDCKLLDEHETFVREMERELSASEQQSYAYSAPALEPGIRNENDNMPKLSRMQIDLLVSCLANDMARLASLQFTNSVGNARMKWVGVEEGHHTLSHDPDLNEESQEKLLKINRWFCGELLYLVQKLADTREPGGDGSLLDNTTIVWTNELGKGNSHTHNDIPFLLVGGGLGFKMGRSLKYKRVAHNRLLLAFAHAFGNHVPHFGKPELCEGGALPDLV